MSDLTEPLNDPCCDHLHGCGLDRRHYHKCCGHWHGGDTSDANVSRPIDRDTPQVREHTPETGKNPDPTQRTALDV
jgi:hypothetical protein